ncbi:hypothetical protein Mgra_00004367 [Meloidogyne graminicola]|uniref:Uncharacterized protein n=1 Tax=Meloidogyne graminicola TaxID=189291 RepID=A0A8S9ZTA1_9BILA|nr:hypothetical protein Mgra_00004367 [Meloidogyne graminicola]
MAFNIANKKALAEELIPEVTFSVSTIGITINSPRLDTARFVQFDVAGKCRSCRSESVEIDYVVTPGGISLHSNRLKGEKHVAFDTIYEIPQHSLFRLKSRGKVFNIKSNDSTAKARTSSEAKDQSLIDEFLEPIQPKKMRTEDPVVSDPDIEFVGEVLKNQQPDEQSKEQVIKNDEE